MAENKLAPAKIILVLIILLSFGTVMGIIGFSLGLKKSPPVAVQPTPTPNTETADWKTYRNEKYGFEIQYLSRWQTKIDGGIINLSSGSSFEIIENENDKHLSLDNWIQEASIVGDRPTILAAAELIDLNGIKAYKLESGLNPPNPLFDVIIADKNNRIFTLHAESKNLDDGKSLNQMLSTFKFIEK